MKEEIQHTDPLIVGKWQNTHNGGWYKVYYDDLGEDTQMFWRKEWKKPKKIAGHNHGNYVVSQHRVAPTQNPFCNRAYTPSGDTYERTTPLSTNELNARARFTAVAAAVKARKSDLMKMTQDQIDFKAQKDLADGKKTMRAYLWKVCGEEYDASQG